MPRYQEQGCGALVPGRGYYVAKTLETLRGTLVILEFADGQSVPTRECAWGRDIGEEWEHLYVTAEDGTVLFTSTSDVVRIIDPETRSYLYQRKAHDEHEE